MCDLPSGLIVQECPLYPAVKENQSLVGSPLTAGTGFISPAGPQLPHFLRDLKGEPAAYGLPQVRPRPTCSRVVSINSCAPAKRNEASSSYGENSKLRSIAVRTD